MRGTCDACGYSSTPVTEYGEVRQELGRRAAYCDVCASTFISQIDTNPENLRNPLLLYRSIARVANMILDAVHELKNGTRR